jgi:hypothetical protein
VARGCNCGASEVDRARTYNAALQLVARTDMRRGFFFGQRPPDWCQQHNQRILEMTLLRFRFPR